MESVKINYSLLNKEREKILNEKFDQIYDAMNTTIPKSKVAKSKNRCFDKTCNEIGTYKLKDCDGEVHAVFCEEHKGNIDENTRRPRKKERNSGYNNVYGLNLRNNYNID